MIRPHGKWLKFQILAALIPLLAGCTFKTHLQRAAVDHNRVVAETENKLTLLNIVRASKRFPLHFTTFSELTGSAEFNGGASLDASLTSGDDTFSPGISASASTSPSFRLAVLSTEKFQRGVQKTIGSDLVAYYLDAGWPDSLIMALFIERVDIIEKRSGEVAGTLVNDARRERNFEWVLCNYQLRSKPSTTSQPLAEFDQIFSRDIMTNKAKAPADRRKEIKGVVDLVSNENLTLEGNTILLKSRHNKAALTALTQNRCGKTSSSLPSILPGQFSAQTHHLVPFYRSTLGIIYFLGEYARVSEGSISKAYHLPVRDLPTDQTEFCDMRPIIEIRSGDGSGFIDTKLLEKRYFIPKIANESCENRLAPARSMQVIAIVQQLLNLHKSAEDLPTTLSISGGFRR